MVSWMISTSIRLRVVLTAACVVLLAAGYESLREAPLDVFPEFAPPIVEIQTEAPGLSSEQVEALVTLPLENALTGIRGVDAMRSKSVLGMSQIVLVLKHGTDHLRVRQLVQERIAAESRRLPVVAQPPVILQPLSSTSRVMKIGVWSEKLSQQDLTILALWTIRPKLMSVPGVANVAIWGQRDKQFQVLVDPERLRANQVTLDSVLRATADAAVLETGGFVDTPNQRLAVRHLSPIREPADLAATVVAFRGGAPIHLSDVTDVIVGSPPAIGDAVINDGPGLLLIVEKQPEGNTLDVTRGVEAALDTLRPALADVELDPTIFRPATFVERALANLSHALGVGCVLVVVILAAFLFDWRTAFISLTAIPLSLVSAVLLLTWAGATINTMVIAGLVIALGELVDDSIIDVENIARRVRLNHESAEPRSAFDIVLAASLEVRSAVVYATLIVILVFVPVFFMEGLAGAFFRPLASAYVLAISASLLVALTVTPALSYMLLTGRSAERPEAPLARLFKRLYAPVLDAFVGRPYFALCVLVAAFAAGGLAASRLGQEFLPSFQETDFLMHFVEKPGTSVEAMTRVTTQASKDLRAVPGVRNFGSHIGRAEVADEPVGPNFTELWISIDPDVDYQTTIRRVEEVVYAYPGLYRDLLTYLRERIKEVLTGSSATIVVRLFGPDLDVLRAKAKEVEAAMQQVEGAINVKVEPQVLVPQIEVRLRPDAAERYGLTAGHVRRASTALLKGAKVEEVPYTKSRVYLLDQIIAVTEVKKTLYTDKLLEAHENLRSIMDLKPSTGRRIARTVRRAFQDITGSPIPDDPATLPPLQHSLYHLLVIEAGWPLRIVLGYRGFANETTFRKGIVDYLTKILGTHGSGPRSIPGFIIGPNAAAFKNVSMPWGSPIDDDGTWPLLQTNGCLKPAYVLLEAIWTRLSNLGYTDDSVFGEDLEVEEWNRLVDCQIVPDKGWAYNTYPVEVPAYISGGVKEWTPFYVSAAAYAVAKTLFDGWGILNLDDLQGDPELLRAAEELRRLRIIGPDAGNPRLMGVLLQSPLAARLSDEKYAIGENSSGRMFRWMKKHYPNQRIVLAVP